MTPLRSMPESTLGTIPVDLEEDEDMADFAPPPLTPRQSPLPDEVTPSEDEDIVNDDAEEAESEQNTPEIETADAATQTEEPTQAVCAMTVAAAVQHRFAQLLEIGTRDQVEHALHQLMSAAVAYNPRPYLDSRAVRREPHSPESQPDEP